MTGASVDAAQFTARDVERALREARERTLALVASVAIADLERIHSPLMSPLAWDLGHIAAYEDLWLAHRFAGRPLLRADLADVYDAFETPRAVRAQAGFLSAAKAREYLGAVRARVLDVIAERGIGDGTLHEMVLRHEHQHNETMLQTIQLAQLPDYALAGATPPASRAFAATGLELIEVPSGECLLGAPGRAPAGAPAWTAFSFDNERPCHRTDVRAFLIGQVPITNATYLTFVEGGGYERREWWSDEGWAWKEQYDITRPGGWTADLSAEWRLGKYEPLQPDQPVVHVCWFEADAFARAHRVRLPTEAEWEKAATWDQESATARGYPWGDQPPIAGVHANIDQLGLGPAGVGAFPAGRSPNGCLGMIGDVWEWTASDFRGYPGFVAHPYPQYSEVFFDGGYKVLRGGSWATRSRVATPTFRNWDFPQRRQIFSGLRIARDL